MPHSFGKHDVVEHEDQGLIRPKSGTRVDPGSSFVSPSWDCPSRPFVRGLEGGDSNYLHPSFSVCTLCILDGQVLL